MKSALSCLLPVLCLFVSCASAAEVFRCDFTEAELAAWTMPPQAKRMRGDALGFIRISVPDADKSGRRTMTRPFDITPYRGQILELSCRVRADGVSEPPAYYNGVKVMISFAADGTKHWRNASRVWGSFDWKPVGALFAVPETADNAVLYLGLQDSSGTADFSGFTINAMTAREAYPPVAELPGDFRSPYTPRVAELPPHRGAMSPPAYRKGDLDVLAAWGANLVRWQLIRNWGKTGTERDLDEYHRWLDAKLDEFDHVVADCRRLGIKVVFDLHSPPGGRDAMKNNDMAMFHEPEYARAFVAAWEKIARRLKGRAGDVLFGYDLVNEPRQTGPAPDNYLKLQYDAARAIRAIDPETPILVESNQAAAPSTFAYLTPLPLRDVIYQVHMYHPHAYTHQGIPGQGDAGQSYAYPGKIGGVAYDRDALRRHLEPVRRFQQKYGARIYVGEFAATRWAEGADRYLADCIALFEEYGWDWSYHAFRESKTWDVECEDGGDYRNFTKATAPSKRLQALQNGFRANGTRQAAMPNEAYP